MNPIYRFAVHLALVALGLFAAALSAECLLRLTVSKYDITGRYWGEGAFASDEENGFRHAPGYEGYVHRRKIFHAYCRINHLGLRESDFDRQMNYRKKIMVIGDSFAFGAGVPEENGVSALLQKKLNPDGIGVLNASQFGYCTAQEAAFAKRIGPIIEPDLILLFMYPGNDFTPNLQKDYLKFEVVDGFLMSADRRGRNTFIDYLRTHSYLIFFIEEKIRRIVRNMYPETDINRPIPRDIRNQVEEATAGSLESLRQYCRLNGIRLGVVIIPVNDPDKMRMADHILSAGNYDYLNLGGKGFTKKDRFEIDSHWNKSGHRKAAVLTDAFIRKQYQTALFEEA